MGTARQNKLLEHPQVFEFDLAPDEVRSSVGSAAAEVGLTAIIAWQDESHWTLLGTSALASRNGKSVIIIPRSTSCHVTIPQNRFRDLFNQMTIDQRRATPVTELLIERADGTLVPIWVPAGDWLFEMWGTINILFR